MKNIGSLDYRNGSFQVPEQVGEVWADTMVAIKLALQKKKKKYKLLSKIQN